MEQFDVIKFQQSMAALSVTAEECAMALRNAGKEIRKILKAYTEQEEVRKLMIAQSSQQRSSYSRSVKQFRVFPGGRPTDGGRRKKKGRTVGCLPFFLCPDCIWIG